MPENTGGKKPLNPILLGRFRQSQVYNSLGPDHKLLIALIEANGDNSIWWQDVLKITGGKKSHAVDLVANLFSINMFFKVHGLTSQMALNIKAKLQVFGFPGSGRLNPLLGLSVKGFKKGDKEQLPIVTQEPDLEEKKVPEEFKLTAEEDAYFKEVMGRYVQLHKLPSEPKFLVWAFRHRAEQDFMHHNYANPGQRMEHIHALIRGILVVKEASEFERFISGIAKRKHGPRRRPPQKPKPPRKGPRM